MTNFFLGWAVGVGIVCCVSLGALLYFWNKDFHG